MISKYASQGNNNLSLPLWSQFYLFMVFNDNKNNLCCRCVQLFSSPWTIAGQAPLSMGFSRQECWSGLPCPPPGDLSNPGIKPMSPQSPAVGGGFFTTGATWPQLEVKFLGDGFLDMTVKVRAKRKYKKLTTRNDCTHSKIGLWW